MRASAPACASPRRTTSWMPASLVCWRTGPRSRHACSIIGRGSHERARAYPPDWRAGAAGAYRRALRPARGGAGRPAGSAGRGGRSGLTVTDTLLHDEPETVLVRMLTGSVPVELSFAPRP